MSGRIPENILEDILSRTDIVEVISSYLPLKKAGRNFKTNCPFHHEKTASFVVSPEKQIYHCFGCSESGNVFKFLMRHERMEFPEAVEMLAKRLGVIIPETQKHSKEPSSSTLIYSKINDLAVSFYESNLAQTPAAIEYLHRRQIKPQTIKEFRLGYAASGWDGLINFLRLKLIGLDLIEKSGLALAKERGGYYDRFRNRIIFPVFDVRSRALGFGARVMDQSLPKYVNSPETPIYTKGRNLYGLNLSKDYIRQSDSAVIVEGYLDFIIPYQEGVKNIVASCGTALALEQIRLLKRYTHNVVMIYDGDAAGELATLRNLDILIEEGMNVKIVSLPVGFDPDLLVRKFGVAKLKSLIAQASNLFDYKFGILKTRHGIIDANAKSLIAAEMLSTINKFQNAIIRSEYIRHLSEGLKVQESYLLEELKKIKPLDKHFSLNLQEKKKKLAINPAEKLLIKFMLEEKNVIERIRLELAPTDFQDERTSKIVALIYDLITQGKTVSPNILMNYFDEDAAAELLCESAFMPDLNLQERDKAVSDCIQRLKRDRLKSKRQNLHTQIKNAQAAGDQQALDNLVKQFQDSIEKG
ncbi:MAG: DNA primase [Candidatus Omnitrophica bacterium]|jgi:DNA primase|nr:DNA primase [Candidatus Omnitrophota bacterium]